MIYPPRFPPIVETPDDSASTGQQLPPAQPAQADERRQSFYDLAMLVDLMRVAGSFFSR